MLKTCHPLNNISMPVLPGFLFTTSGAVAKTLARPVLFTGSQSGLDTAVRLCASGGTTLIGGCAFQIPVGWKLNRRAGGTRQFSYQI